MRQQPLQHISHARQQFTATAFVDIPSRAPAMALVDDDIPKIDVTLIISDRLTRTAVWESFRESGKLPEAKRSLALRKQLEDHFTECQKKALELAPIFPDLKMSLEELGTALMKGDRPGSLMPETEEMRAAFLEADTFFKEDAQTSFSQPALRMIAPPAGYMLTPEEY